MTAHPIEGAPADCGGDLPPVDWWAVHQYASPVLSSVESWPPAGSVEWQQLSGDDPAKLAAVLDAGRHWALRIDTIQHVASPWADASRAVADSAKWISEHNRFLLNRNKSYIRRTA